MDAVTALTEPVDRRAPTTAGDPAAHGPDSGAGSLSDLKRLADELVKALEFERARVIGVLADEVLSVITMARYLIEDAAQRVTRGEFDETSEALQNASTRLRDATRQLVTLCSELRPRALDDLGLLPALTSYLRDFGRENRAILVSPRISVTEKHVPAELRLAVFRIVQVALSNVARHSKATSARVFLSRDEDELRLVIEDNGVGFDVEHWRHRRHGSGNGCGLGMISRWAEMSGGHCTLETAPRHGARVQVLWRGPPSVQPAGAGRGSDFVAAAAQP